MSGQNGRVGIDKEENVAARNARAGVPHGRDVTVMDRQHERARIPAYLSGGVSGGIIHHDDFE
jgi:hypothetical protein